MSVALEPPPVRTRRNNVPKQQQKQIRSVRILLRPGNYWLKQAIDIQAHPGVTILFKTVELPRNLYRPILHATEVTEQPLPSQPLEAESTTRKRTPSSFLNLFRCKRHTPPDETDLAEISEFTEDCRDNSGNSIPSSESKHATLILRSRKNNEPVFRVRQGILLVRNVEIQHNSLGLDIWNGNAAIQIQPPMGDDENPLPVEPLPVAYMDSVHISSQTGRGIVSIDGGKVVLRKCAVTDCAATGVYIGGPGSQAVIEKSDVIRNGVGNRIRRGIARGHSGIYLEQGFATIRNSNVSSNVLTGISVVSPDNAFIVLENSTLMNNGTYQLELPPTGSISRQRSTNVNNTMAARGDAPLRSGLTLTEPLPSSIVLYQHLTNNQQQHTANAALMTMDV
jgi:Right handed beta helix region